MKLAIIFTVFICSLTLNLKSERHLSMKSKVLRDTLERLAKMESTAEIDFDKLPVFKNQEPQNGKKHWKDPDFPPKLRSIIGKDKNGKFLDDEDKAIKAIKTLMINKGNKNVKKMNKPKFMRIKEIEKGNGITN